MKSSKSVVRTRILQIRRLIVRGYVHSKELKQKIQKMDELSPEQQEKEGWVPIRVRDQMLNKYVVRAMDMASEEITDDTNRIKNFLINAHLEVYRTAMLENKLSIAHRALIELAVLTGVKDVKDIGKIEFDKFDRILTAEESEELTEEIGVFLGYKDILKKDIDNADIIIESEE